MIQRFIKKSARGFTLIELLVVIAIIGILAGIVLASLNSARQGANFAAIKEQMSGVRTAAEVYYGQNANQYSAAGTTAGACTGAGAPAMFTSGTGNMDTLVSDTQTKAGGASNVDCGSSTSAWAMAAYVAGDGGFCVDSTGAANSYSAATGLTGAGNPKSAAGATVCQ